MLRRALFAFLLAAILSACSAGTGVFGPSTGTVTGHVQIRTCGGAYRTDQSGCQSRPYAGVTLTFQLTPAAGKGSDKTVTTGPDGSYRIVLPPGTYSVKAAGPLASATLPKPQSFADAQAAVRGFGVPRQVIVTAGKTVTADFAYTIELL